MKCDPSYFGIPEARLLLIWHSRWYSTLNMARIIKSSLLIVTLLCRRRRKKNCPPLIVSQSNLKVEVSVEMYRDTIVSSAFDTSGVLDLERFYSSTQTPMNIYLDQGTAYVIDVKDAAGCVAKSKRDRL